MKKHNDCLHFAPIDAAKGICRIENVMVNIDHTVCENFKAVPKCRNCSHFKDPNKDEIGTCVGLEKKDWTFGDLNALTCSGHKFK